jgi:pimeloyl-ACP methyl ester carboxylesterase
MDALLASMGGIALKPLRIQASPVRELLHNQLSLRATPGGTSYALKSGRGTVLLIISTTGVSISIWSNLLCDGALSRPCLLVQSHCGPLFDGGTCHRSTLWNDVAAIKDVLTTEAPNDIDILAWCDGARVAIELARSIPERIASLTLLSPTFHGAVDSKLYPSPFEDNLNELRKLLSGDPGKDRFLLETIAKSVTGEPGSRSGDPRRRQNAVLRRPPHAYAHELLMPLSTVEYFRNYVDRLTSDESYDVRSALAAIQRPILLLTGTDDAVVNTTAARDVLRENGRNVSHVTIRGAGHHTQVLQYSYFRYVFDCFMASALPRATARLEVEKLSQ